MQQNVVLKGTETVSHIGPKIWNLLTNDCNKGSTTLEKVKVTIKK